MLHKGSTEIQNPLVPKAHNGECQNLLFPLQIKPVYKIQLKLVCGFLLVALMALMG